MSVNHHFKRSSAPDDPLVRRVAPGAWTRREEPDIDLVPAGVHERIAAAPSIRLDLVEGAREYLDVRPTPSAEILAGAVAGWWGW